MTDISSLMNGASRLPTPEARDSEFAAIAAWLDAAPTLPASDELPTLLAKLAPLRAGGIASAQRAAILDRLYERVIALETVLLPTLAERGLAIPVSRRTRSLIRQLQELLLALADCFGNIGAVTDGVLVDAGKTLWRRMHALGQHLLIAHLAGSPATKGVWQQLHETYAAAERLGLTHVASGTKAWPLRNVYFHAVLLGCAQPASFTSKGIEFVADCLYGAAARVEFGDGTDASDRAGFWIDTTRDAPAIAWARKPAPPDTEVRVFSCARIAAGLCEHLSRIEAGASAEALGLPALAESPAGRGVLRRLIRDLGMPGKRRFPRRHQYYRTVLCSGLSTLWRLFRDGSDALVETSNWMIINESPDGCAVRHVSGKTGELAVGDIAAIRNESAGVDAWQTCIVRWALSENQEHLELGLQILSTHAVPAILAQPKMNRERNRLPVLVLPKIKDVRTSDLLIAPADAVRISPDNADDADPLVLVIERDKVEVREAKATRLEEQNGLIEIFAIERASLVK